MKFSETLAQLSSGDKEERSGKTVLMHLADLGKYDAMAALLDSPNGTANIDATDENQNTALCYALGQSDNRVGALLVEKGASVERAMELFPEKQRLFFQYLEQVKVNRVDKNPRKYPPDVDSEADEESNSSRKEPALKRSKKV